MDNPVGRLKFGRFIVANPDNPTYVLKYTSKTRTAINRAEKAGPLGQNVQYDIDLSTDEDSSVLATAKAWRSRSEDEGDLFIVEVKPGDQASQFSLPFANAVILADAAQENLASPVKR